MPAAYHISEDQELITIHVDDIVDIDDLQSTAGDLLQEPDYDPALPLLVDLRGMQLTPNRSKQESFGEFMISHFGPERSASIAVVIDQGLEAKLCAAIYWLCCAVHRTELFDDYELALKWLFKRELGPSLQGQIGQI